MKDLFSREGHITDYGFELLLKGEPTELQRLELAEHLDFCDKCVVEYMARLQEDVLISPAESVSNSVFAQIRKRAAKIFFSRYGMVAVAACFTMGIWCTGVFSLESINQEDINRRLAQSRVITFVDKGNMFLDSITEKTNSLLDNLKYREVFDDGKK